LIKGTLCEHDEEPWVLPLYATRIEDLGPDDFVKVDCAAVMSQFEIRGIGSSAQFRFRPNVLVRSLSFHRASMRMTSSKLREDEANSRIET
jgi:hypothetical protein